MPVTQKQSSNSEPNCQQQHVKLNPTYGNDIENGA